MSTARPALRLTFDDGPDPTWTPRVLDVLARAGATATFFVLGERVREAPELLADILAGGHTIGLHGDAHLDHSKSSAGQIGTDTDTALRTLRSSGVEPRLWRLPWGRSGDGTAELAARLGLRVVGWDADTHDWRGDAWGDQPTTVTETARRGGVVLLHDAIGPGATRAGCENTLEITTVLLSAADAAGTPVTALPGQRAAAHA